MKMGKPNTVDGRTVLYTPDIDGKCDRCGKIGIGIAITITHQNKTDFRDYNKHICYTCVLNSSHYEFGSVMYLSRVTGNLTLEQMQRWSEELAFRIVDRKLREEQDKTKK